MEELKKAVPNPNLIEREVMDDSNLSKAVKTAIQAQAKTKSVVEHIANQIFQLYANFLSEKARQLWKKIVWMHMPPPNGSIFFMRTTLRGTKRNCHPF